MRISIDKADRRPNGPPVCFSDGIWVQNIGRRKDDATLENGGEIFPAYLMNLMEDKCLAFFRRFLEAIDIVAQ